ncbi:MAG: hypothetical protein V3T23_00620 [Nitrososphaerales archaeon]
MKEQEEKFARLTNSRPLDIHRWSNHQQINALIDRLVYDIFGLGIYKRQTNMEKLKKHIKVVVLDLYMAHQTDPDMYVGYSRRAQDYSGKSRYSKLRISYRPLLKVVDALRSEELGYIEHHKGFKDRNRGRGYQSRMRATDKLISLFGSYVVKPCMVSRANDEEIIILRDENGKNIEYEETLETVRMRINLSRLNDELENTLLNLYVPDRRLDEINEILQRDIERNPIDFTRKRLKRIFNNGSFEQGGRFYYGWWQEIPKEFRKHIHIDSKSVVEIDYSGMQIRMMYAREGLEPPNDPYVIPAFPVYDRETVKRVLNTMINAVSRESALRSIRKEVPKHKYTLSLRLTTVEDLVGVVTEHHRPIKKYFHSGEGIKLQREDSDIAEQVMLEMANRGVTVLPVHDSFIVRWNEERALRDVMHKVFEERVLAIAKMKRNKTTLEETWEERAASRNEPVVETLDVKELVRHWKKYERYSEMQDEFYSVRKWNVVSKDEDDGRE